MQNNKISLLSYLKISILYICFFLFSISICITISEAIHSSMLDFFSIDICQVISLILILIYIDKKFNITLKSLLSKKNINKSTVIAVILLLFSSYVIINSVTSALDNNISIIPKPDNDSNSIDSLNNISLFFYFLSISVFSPIMEEILFRGILLLKLKDSCNNIIALIISSVVFSLLHSAGYSQINALFCGLLWGIITLKTNSIICSTISHIMWNCLTTLIIILKIYNLNIIPMNNGYFQFNILTQIVSAILFVISCFVIFKGKPKKEIAKL